jgi:hypothetical protein
MLHLEQLEFGNGWKQPESPQSRSGRRIVRTIVKSEKTLKGPSDKDKNEDIVPWRSDTGLKKELLNRDFHRVELLNRLHIRSSICEFLILALGFSTVSYVALILLNGFHPYAFHVDESFLKWFGGATIAQVAILLGVFVRESWREYPK